MAGKSIEKGGSCRAATTRTTPLIILLEKQFVQFAKLASISSSTTKEKERKKEILSVLDPIQNPHSSSRPPRVMHVCIPPSIMTTLVILNPPKVVIIWFKTIIPLCGYISSLGHRDPTPRACSPRHPPRRQYQSRTDVCSCCFS